MDTEAQNAQTPAADDGGDFFTQQQPESLDDQLAKLDESSEDDVGEKPGAGADDGAGEEPGEGQPDGEVKDPEFWRKQYEALLPDYTRKSQELATLRPLVAGAPAAGIPGSASGAATDPIEALRQELRTQYPDDPLIHKLADTVVELKQGVSGVRQNETQRATQGVVSEIVTFSQQNSAIFKNPELAARFAEEMTDRLDGYLPQGWTFPNLVAHLDQGGSIPASVAQVLPRKLALAQRAITGASSQARETRKADADAKAKQRAEAGGSRAVGAPHTQPEDKNIPRKELYAQGQDEWEKMKANLKK